MNSIIKDLIKDKSVAILGYGREGRSSLDKVLAAGGSRSITVLDVNDVSKDLPEGVGFVSGKDYMASLDDYDIVFKSPGVVLERPIGEYKCLVTSQTEIFMRAFGDRVIGVTGTKGKSTTSALIYHVLKTAGKNVLFGGNIGIPVFTLADSVKDDTIAVLELSCHQLEYLKTDPHVSVLLNIYEDHLDHYGTRENYALAKKHIFDGQKENDVLFTTKETYDNEGLARDIKGKCVIVDASMAPFKEFSELNGAKLIGSHNVLNCAFAYEVAKLYGVSRDTFIKAVETFEPLPHRLEHFGVFGGMDFYDDSISTTVKSAISAIETVGNAKFILLGGMERNIDYTELVEFLHKTDLSYIVCMYDSGRRICDMYLKDQYGPPAVWVEDLKAAVEFVFDKKTPGGACILSPAAASYGYFKNFEDRGETFKKLVKECEKF